MIQKWRLHNFKSVYDPTELSFLPLTVFAGANSSGKSTFIQSMLLVTQTIDNQVFSKPIVLNGHITRLGTFEDLASSNSGKKDISIGFTLEFTEQRVTGRGEIVKGRRILRRPELSGATVDCDFAFSAEAKDESKEILQLQPLLTYCRMSARIADAPEANSVVLRRLNKPIEDRIKELGLNSKSVPPNELIALAYEVVEPKSFKSRRFGFRLPIRSKAVGAHLSHFLPTSLSMAYDSVEEYAKQIVNNFSSEEPATFDEDDAPYLSIPFLEKLRDILNSGAQLKVPDLTEVRSRRLEASLQELHQELTPSNLLKSISYFGQRRFRALVEPHEEELIQLSKGNSSANRTLTSFPLGEELSGIHHQIRMLFSEAFKYLGPLRDEPKAVYPMEGVTDPSDVGLKGQHTAAVLDLYKNSPIRYIPSSCFKKPGTAMEPKIAALKDAIQDWLSYLTVVTQFRTRDRGIFGHELQVATGGAQDLHNLSHVGVGVSQVLPILVMSLLADSGSVLVFEQPEIHLNPKVQSLLADFMLSMALLQKQCIVETHSEYLINRLRYRAAVDTDDKLSNLMRVYFVENEEGRSKYRELRINRYGAIDDWPHGFFDESPREAEQILRAAMAKRLGIDRKNA
ncbi:conserved protein of unknown function [Nitrospira japonica]|uniref:DUF3696 domain-containing protein n=1 Tax=Nitrospira japonica TaxID=1325564 RepID=A0A1W1I5V9_9BACT|nr:DUF3696 domain-containing protein [Nitrospira japonica]SLM48408.1 conserved protein of unknown function [Nitrospira japonica]